MLSELAVVGLVLGAGGIVLAVVVGGVGYRIGRSIGELERTVEAGLDDLTEAGEDNSDELRNITESLTKIEMRTQNGATRETQVESDGGVGREMDFRERNQEPEPSTYVRQRIGDRNFEISLDRRRYVTEIVVRSAGADQVILPAILSMKHELEREIESAIEDAHQLTVDVQAEPDAIDILVPRTDEGTIDEVVETVTELLPQWLDAPQNAESEDSGELGREPPG